MRMHLAITIDIEHAEFLLDVFVTKPVNDAPVVPQLFPSCFVTAG
eukprot:SAG31_NODE_276_length_18650_cov_5.821842_1_plen_45_part_00